MRWNSIFRRLNFVCCSDLNIRNAAYTGYRSKDKPRRTWITYSLLTLPATAFALGFWQIHRREWKINLIKTLSARIPAEPIILPSTVNKSTDLPEFSHVKVRGHFDHSREVLIGPRPLIEDLIPPESYGSEWLVGRTDLRTSNKVSQASMGVPSAAGFFVVTPFYLADRPGVSILVNRGWVPTGARDPIIRPKGQIAGTIELSGYIRYPEKPPPFGSERRKHECLDDANQQPQYQYYCRHVTQMAEDLNTLPIFIDSSYQSSIVGGPIGGQTRIALRNEHASYIFTWFTLGTIGVGMWIYFFVL